MNKPILAPRQMSQKLGGLLSQGMMVQVKHGLIAGEFASKAQADGSQT